MIPGKKPVTSLPELEGRARPNSHGLLSFLQAAKETLTISATNAAETDVLELIFTNANWPNIGDATGLRGSTTAGVFYISLHTSDPGETGGQSTNETSYTNYARVSVARSGSGWTVSGSNNSNAAAITFAQCGATGATLTHFGIGTDSSGAGNLLFKGALDSSLAVSNGVTPSFAVGALDVNVE